MNGGRVPPNDMEAERAVLGAAMIDRDCFLELAELLDPADFYSDAHSKIYLAMVACESQGHATDTIGIRGQLGSKLEGVGGDDYLLKLTDTIPVVALAAKHAARIQKLATLRAHIHQAHQIAADCYSAEDIDGTLDEIERRLASSPERRGAARSLGYRQVIVNTFEQISAQADRRAANSDHIAGQPTGITQLDRHLCGMGDGHLVIVAGRPGMGKSAFALSLVNATAETGDDGVFFSLEMTDEQWGRRHIAQESQVDSHKLRSGDISRDEWPRLAGAAGKLSELPIHFWDKPNTTIRELISESRRLHRESKAAGRKGLRLIVVDYIQLCRAAAKNRSREEEVAEVSRELKGLAKELRCPVVALAQLNRGVEQRPNKRPMLSALRERGAIEQAADTILVISRDEVYNPYKPDTGMVDNRGIAEVIVAKNREGGVGMVKAAWVPHLTLFHDLDEHNDAGDYHEY